MKKVFVPLPIPLQLRGEGVFDGMCFLRDLDYTDF